MIGMAGAAHERKTPYSELRVGTPCLDDANRTWVYVKFHATVAGGAAVTIDGSFNTATGTGYTNGASAAAAGDFGWVRKTTSPL
jgi:hypothetical protein